MSVLCPVWRALVIASLLLLPAAATEAEGGSAPPSGPPASACASLVPGEYTIQVDVDGTAREVLVHVPALAPGSAPVPLVIGYHGYTATAPQLAQTAALGASADQDGFLVFYPQGIADGFGQPDWVFPGAPGPAPAGVDDMRLTEVLLDLAAAEGCVDPDRVILMGHSKGGGMAQAAACALADRVAGVVLVAAIQFGAPCEPSRPVPVVALHALDDPVLPYSGGRIPGTPSWFPELLPVEEAVAAWAARNGCDAGPVTTPGAGGAVLASEGCDAPVELRRLDAGGHAYPALASELVRRLALEHRISGPTPTPR